MQVDGTWKWTNSTGAILINNEFVTAKTLLMAVHNFQILVNDLSK